MRKYVIILFNGELLYAVIGPFASRGEAASYSPSDPDEQRYRRVVVELFPPE